MYITNNINFYQTPSISQMISIFIKHSVHHKRYQFLSNTLYITNDINFYQILCTSQIISIFIKHSVHHNNINFYQTLCTSQMISIFIKHSVHHKWYQFLSNTLYITNDINFYQTLCTSQIISIFIKHSVYKHSTKFVFHLILFFHFAWNFIDIFIHTRKMSCFYSIKVIKVGDRSWGRPEGSLFNSYYTEV